MAKKNYKSKEKLIEMQKIWKITHTKPKKNKEQKNDIFYGVNNNLYLLADVVCKEARLSNEAKIKEFVFTEINKLKEYAVYYNKNIKNLDIKEINNLIEIELSKNKNFTSLEI